MFYQQSISNLTAFSYNCFRYYASRNSSSSNNTHYLYKNLINQWGERFVHVIGAAYEGGPNETQILFGRTNASERYSYIYLEQLMAHATPPVTSPLYIRHPIIKTVIHEIGHQFGDIDDHKLGDDGLNPGEAAVLNNLNSADQSIRAKALKDLAYYRGRPLKTVVSADDYKECVQTDAFADETHDYIFCPYHNNIIRGYTGW